MIIHSLSGVKGRLIFINRGCKSHLKNNTKAKRKLYLLGGDLSCGTQIYFCMQSVYFEVDCYGNLLFVGNCFILWLARSF